MNQREKLQTWLNSQEHLFCHVCGLGVALVIGSTHRTSFEPVIRCGRHVSDLKQYYGVVTGSASGANQEISLIQMPKNVHANRWIAMRDEDARWFAANPHRSHRLRRTHSTRGGFVDGYMTLVRQITSGTMKYLHLENRDVSIPDDDDLLLLIFEELKGTDERIGEGRDKDLQDVIRRAVRLNELRGFA